MTIPLFSPKNNRSAGGYAVALLSVFGAFGLRFACDDWLSDRSALDFFLAATAVSAWYGGAGPSAFSIVLSTLLGLWFFVPPRRTFVITDVVDLIETGSFIFSGSAIAFLSWTMKRAMGLARKNEEEAHRALEARQRIEWELQVLNEQLEEKVDQRTVELRLALRELEAYAHSIAHSLRSPLRAVAGMADILREDEGDQLSPEARERLDRIQEATYHMDELIRGLLDYSRVSREEFPIMRLHLDEILRDVLHTQASSLDARDAEVTIVDPLPDIIGHREPLVQVLTHLISNAAKFVAPGVKPRIRIGADQVGTRVRVWVEDNGIGIEPRYHDRIFGVFERLHSSEEYPGTGIGLAIVRRCMERMGGRASVESEPGKGSRFWIEASSAETNAELLVRSA